MPVFNAVLCLFFMLLWLSSVSKKIYVVIIIVLQRRRKTLFEKSGGYQAYPIFCLLIPVFSSG